MITFEERGLSYVLKAMGVFTGYFPLQAVVPHKHWSTCVTYNNFFWQNMGSSILVMIQFGVHFRRNEQKI